MINSREQEQLATLPKRDRIHRDNRNIIKIALVAKCPELFKSSIAKFEAFTGLKVTDYADIMQFIADGYKIVHMKILDRLNEFRKRDDEENSDYIERIRTNFISTIENEYIDMIKLISPEENIHITECIYEKYVTKKDKYPDFCDFMWFHHL